MKLFSEIQHMADVHPVYGMATNESGGLFRLGKLSIIASWQMGWDHVSVSLPDRCPTWEELERVKRAFFRADETAMQLHVPPSDHKNLHPYCLHLWRPQWVEVPRPPAWMVA